MWPCYNWGCMSCDFLSLFSNKSCTFPFENYNNVYRFTISPDGSVMICVDEGKYHMTITWPYCTHAVDGKALLVNLHHHIELYRFNFKTKVYDIKYSPDGKWVKSTCTMYM